VNQVGWPIAGPAFTLGEMLWLKEYNCEAMQQPLVDHLLLQSWCPRFKTHAAHMFYTQFQSLFLLFGAFTKKMIRKHFRNIFENKKIVYVQIYRDSSWIIQHHMVPLGSNIYWWLFRMWRYVPIISLLWCAGCVQTLCSRTGDQNSNEASRLFTVITVVNIS